MKKLLFPILALILALGLIVPMVMPATPAYASPDTEILRPNAAGDETGIASQNPGTGAHYDKVDEDPADTTTYVSTSDTNYQRDLYNLPSHSTGSGTINFITVHVRCYWAGNADPNQASIKIAIKSGVGTGAPTTVDESAEKTHLVRQIWDNFSNQWNTNPATGSAWTWDEIDNLQIGVALREAVSGGPANEECTQVYVDVDYTPVGGNPVPTTTSIDPTSKIKGDPGFTMTVNGTNFIATSVVRFAGADRTTVFGSSTQLTATILGSDLAAAGTFNITVFNPTPGGGTSNAQTFTVIDPAPTYMSGASTATGSDVTSVTVNNPAGTASGDLLIGVVVTDGDAGTFTAPSLSWNPIDSGTSDPGATADQVTVGVWYLIAGGSEPASYQWTWTSAQRVYAFIIRITGQHATTPINIWGVNTGTSATPNCPTVTTTADNTMVLRLFGADGGLTGSSYPSSPPHNGIMLGRSGTGGTDCNGGAAYIIQAAAGGTGTAAFTVSASDEWRALTVAIAPVAVAADKVFTGPGDFSVAGNWDGSTLPAAGENLIILNACTFNNAANDTITYGTLTLGQTATAGTINWPGSPTKTLKVTDVSAAVAASAIDMTNGGTLQIGGSFTLANLTFTSGTGTVVFNGAGAQTIPSTTFNHLTTSTGGTKTLGGAVTANGNLTIGASTTLSTAGNALNVMGNWSNDGAFTHGGGTVTLNGSGSQNIGGGSITSFNNLTISNTSVDITASTNFNVAGTLTVNTNAGLKPDAGVVINPGGAAGTITGSGAILVTRTLATADYLNQYKFTTNTLSNMTVVYAGTGAQTVNATSAVGNYGGLATSGTGAKTLGGDVTVIGFLSIAGLTTLDVSGSNYGLTVSGNWINDGTFNAQSGTVTFNGTGGIYGSIDPTFNHLTTATGGTRTLYRDVTVNGNLTIGTGTTLDVSASDYALTVGGDWIHLGFFNRRNGTVTLNGSSPQNMTGGVTNFYNLTLDNSNGLTIASDESIHGTLTLTDGKITTNALKVQITSTGSVSGGSSASYVFGNLQKWVATGAALVTFEVGTASGYDPVNVQFGNVTGENYLTASATGLGEHPNIGTSTIDPTNDVNVYWSFTDYGITFDNYSATFNFRNPEDIDGTATPSNFIVGKFLAGWTYPTVGTKTSTSTEITGETAFSDFVVGESLNTPPVMSTATITSSDDPNAYETSTLTASGTATDPDPGDILTYEYDWWVNAGSTGQTGTTLTGTHFNKGDVVTCWIRAYDGTDYSGWMESNTIVIDNSPPVAVNDDYNVKVNTTLHIVPPGVLDNDYDVDVGDSLHVSHLTTPPHGDVSMWADGHFNYTPDTDFIGTDTFTYYAHDGTDESVATVNLYVDDYPVYNLDTGQGYLDIQSAIDDATPGDTIMVEEGTYTEVLLIDKPLTLQSEGEAAATIIEDGPEHIIISLGIDEDDITPMAETVVLDGFTVTGADFQIGIYDVDNGSTVTIKDCIIDGGTVGIYSYGASVDNGSTVNIVDNVISNAAYGIYFELVTGGSTVNITGNTVSTNPISGIFGICFGTVDGSSTVNITGNTITSNIGTAGGIYFDTGVDVTKVSVNFNNIFGNPPFGIFNAGTGELDAENNWWGYASGPFHPATNPTGEGNGVSDFVDYDPWLGAMIEDFKMGTVPADDPYEFDALAEADTIVIKNGTGTPTITVAKYSDNPGDEPAFFSPLGKYIDVHIDSIVGVDSIEIRLYYTDAELAASGLEEASLQLWWWDSATSSWVVCPPGVAITPSDIPGYRGYIWAVIDGTTTPNLTDLMGAPLGGGGMAPAQVVGGGGGLFIRPKVTGLLAAPILELEPNGVIPVSCRLKTANSALTLYIAKGTKMLDSAGEPLELLSALPEPTPPPPPSAIILAYNLGQSGATFSPPITLTFNYNPADFPEGVVAEDLYIAYWDGSAWVPLATEINTMEREASCQTSHFTIFALIAPVSENTPPAPAAFSTSNLSIQPLEVQPQEAVTVTLSVANTGGTEGSYSVVLMIDGAKETEKSVTVAAGGSQSVSFSVTQEEAGSYSVAVDELTGSFTVAAASSSTPPPEAKTPISWWIWVIVGVVVVGFIVFFLVRSRAY